MGQFVQHMHSFLFKLYNLRLMDRRLVKIRVYLVDLEKVGDHSSNLSMTYEQPTITYDKKKDIIEYNLYTRALLNVQSTTDVAKTTKPM